MFCGTATVAAFASDAGTTPGAIGRKPRFCGTPCGPPIGGICDGEFEREGPPIGGDCEGEFERGCPYGDVAGGG
jgi:hypothetical protein